LAPDAVLFLEQRRKTIVTDEKTHTCQCFCRAVEFTIAEMGESGVLLSE
jgi:hypothetical protein